jgi:hypothetical protein
MKTMTFGFALVITSFFSNLAFAAIPCVAEDVVSLPAKLVGLTSLNGQNIKIEITTPGPSKVVHCSITSTEWGDKIHYTFAERFEAEVKVSVANPLSFHPTTHVFKLADLVVEPILSGDEHGRFNRTLKIYDPSLKISYLMFLDANGRVGRVRTKLSNG